MKQNFECPVCRSNNIAFKQEYNKKRLYKKITSFIRNFGKKQSVFKGDITICANCRHAAMDYPPTELQLRDYYKSLYWDGRSVETVKIGLDTYKTDLRAKNQIDFVSGYFTLGKANRILEIGAGPAFASLYFRDKAKNENLMLYTCEPGNQWVDYYKKQDITRIADFFPFETDIKFDYIHTSHWLEHVTDVNKTLEILNRMLEVNGTIFIEVPNTEYGYWDLHILPDAPPHVQFFTRKSLLVLLEQHGFKCESMDEYGITWPEWERGVSDHHNKNNNGYWIKSLFTKIKEV